MSSETWIDIDPDLIEQLLIEGELREPGFRERTFELVDMNKLRREFIKATVEAKKSII